MGALKWRAVTLALVVAACGGGGSSDDDDGTPPPDAGVADAALPPDARVDGRPDAGGSSACLSPPLACPASAPTVGQAGGYKVDAFTLDWTFCAAEGASIAQPIYFNIPADILSFSITVDGGAADTLILQLQLDGQNLMDLTTINRPPFRHGAHVAASVVVPISPNTFPQGPFCVAVVPAALGDVEGELGKLSVASRRDQGGGGAFDLNVVQAVGADIDPGDVDAAIAQAAQIYFNGNAGSLQTVDHYTIQGFDRVSSSGSDIVALRAAQVGTDPRRLNLFVVEDFLDASLFGIAGGVPGPNGVASTGGSGVVVGVAAHRLPNGTIDIDEMAATIGHELGHQLGLFHTSESNGQAHDNFSDTPECTAARDFNHDGLVAPSECVGFSDQNMMFWTTAGVPQTQISVQQSQIIFFSPALR